VVLLADDDEAIASNLSSLLERSGFTVHVTSSGTAALVAVERYNPDICVLDILMPGLDGREVLRRMRQGGRLTPVLLLTQLDSSAERVMAFEDGADDYLNKPFDPLELVARIRAILRRSQPGRPSLTSFEALRAGELRFDRVSRRAWLGENELTLTPKAMLLLDYFMTHPDELLSRDRLLEVLWGFEFPVGTRAVDHRVTEVRKALDDDAGHPRWIETVSGQGYRFVAEVHSAERVRTSRSQAPAPPV
jgi:DNA-binding response OmpR family regulator